MVCFLVQAGFFENCSSAEARKLLVQIAFGSEGRSSKAQWRQVLQHLKQLAINVFSRFDDEELR